MPKRSKRGLLPSQGSQVLSQFLPSHSPNLNPIEKFWSQVRFAVSHTNYFRSFQAFQSALASYLVPLTCYAPKFVSLCGIHR